MNEHDDAIEHDTGGEDDDGQCLSCDGEGGYHDCGDDTCCCAADGEDDPDWVDCADCGGSGLR